MDKYYLDTSIWLDYYEKRDKNGEIAFNLIQWIIENDFVILYSDLNIKELKILGYSQEQIKEMFNIPKLNKIAKVHINRFQLEEARLIAKRQKTPYKDTLHVLLARDNEAILIFTDKHFEKLKHLVSNKNFKELSETKFFL